MRGRWVRGLLALCLAASFSLQLAHVHPGDHHAGCGHHGHEDAPRMASDDPCGLCLVAAQPTVSAAITPPPVTIAARLEHPLAPAPATPPVCPVRTHLPIRGPPTSS